MPRVQYYLGKEVYRVIYEFGRARYETYCPEKKWWRKGASLSQPRIKINEEDIDKYVLISKLKR